MHNHNLRRAMIEFAKNENEHATPRVLGRHEPMPQTIEYYKAQQEREGKLILEMKAEISKLKVRNDSLEKKLLKRNNNVT